MRRSLAAGKSSPPSFCQAISGSGTPLAAHSNRAMLPARTVTSVGVLVKEGNTEIKISQNILKLITNNTLIINNIPD